MDAVEQVLLFLIFLMSLAVGSFLNVCIYRIPKGIFFNKSKSYCPKCQNAICWYDNIPIFSYIILGGKCRHCKTSISIRYPIVEFLNLIFWVATFTAFRLRWETIIYALLFSTLIVMSFIDLDTKEISNSIIIFITLLGIITFIPYFSIPWQDKLIGAFAVSVPMLIIATVTGGMGGGDVKLYFAIGLLLGWKLILLTFLISVILGALGGIIILIRLKEVGRKYEMPFGPYIAIGAAFSIFFGEFIITAYKGFIGM